MPSTKSHSRRKCHEFDHKIQLQLYDGYSIPVGGTEFWVTIHVVKTGNKVLLQLPTINFQIGPASENQPLGPPPPTGTIQTSDGFLPEDLRPTDPVFRSYLGASNNGMSEAFSFLQPPPPLPVPIAGYIVSITLFGSLIIQGAGTTSNTIFAGPQILMPMDIEYLVEPSRKLKINFEISTGASDVTQFTGGPNGAAGTGYRDSHVNDAFDGIVGWAWSDNSNIPDKTNNTLNVWVRIGKMKSGKLKMRNPIQLTNNPVGTFVFDTAVAINRTDKKNIIVSWGVDNVPTTPYRAVSFDGGKTWPINGQAFTTVAGDNRGVASDKFGNIWYGTTNLYDNMGNYSDQPTFWISSDKGKSFNLAYTAPNQSDLGLIFYDFPQFCFGGDGQCNYGLWFTSDSLTVSGDLGAVVGFIPITGCGTYGTGTTIVLNTFTNLQELPSITASADGRVWTQASAYSYWPNFSPYNDDAYAVRFKSPGPIDANYAGPWHIALTPWLVNSPTSYPFEFKGYFNSVQTNIYDDQRQALYALIAQQRPNNQNMIIYLIISRDNGQTWSKPFYISNSDFANRGFQSMALDVMTGDLVFGWYDGRNDKTEKTMEYFGAVLPSDQLTEMVNKIPLSNPLYTIAGPQASVTNPQVVDKSVAVQKIDELLKKKLPKRLMQKLEKVRTVKP